MKIEAWDDYGTCNKTIQITFNKAVVVQNDKKILQKAAIGPFQISQRHFQEMKQDYLDDKANGTTILYDKIKKKISAENPKQSIILGDDPEIDNDGFLIDQDLDPQLDV